MKKSGISHERTASLQMCCAPVLGLTEPLLQQQNTAPAESTHNPTYSRGISEPRQTSPDLHNTTHPTYSIHLM